MVMYLRLSTTTVGAKPSLTFWLTNKIGNAVPLPMMDLFFYAALAKTESRPIRADS